MKIEDYSILIVEDELISLEYLKEVLYAIGAKHIFEAFSADEALCISKENKLDLVFMDINIQGAIDGIKCASLLNKNDFVPIIFTTAYGNTNTINEAKEENMFGYLIKPFQPNDVEASTNVALKMIEQSRALKEIHQQKNKPVEVLSLGKDCIYNFETKTISFCNNPVALTKKELELLDIFCHKINQNISYDYLKEKIWLSKSISDSTIRDTLSRLKRKLPQVNFENISNFGYILRKN